MVADFFSNATVTTFQGFGNILFNGFAFDLSEEDRVRQIGIRCAHFALINEWQPNKSRHEITDKSTGDLYWNDSEKTTRLKCLAIFGGSLIAQPIGLTLNCLNKIGKIVTFAHLWAPSKGGQQYRFTARLGEWTKDLLVVVLTPLILVGMLFASLYGAALVYRDGKKLFGTFERLAYSGGYQLFGDGTVHNYLIAPCFQPSPQSHLGGGDPSELDVW